MHKRGIWRMMCAVCAQRRAINVRLCLSCPHVRRPRRAYLYAASVSAVLLVVGIGFGCYFWPAGKMSPGAEGNLREQARQYEKKPHQPSYHAGVYAGAGNKDKAFETLETAYHRHENMIVYLQVDPRFDSLRDDPRFDELVRRIGIL